MNVDLEQLLASTGYATIGDLDLATVERRGARRHRSQVGVAVVALLAAAVIGTSLIGETLPTGAPVIGEVPSTEGTLLDETSDHRLDVKESARFGLADADAAVTSRGPGGVSPIDAHGPAPVGPAQGADRAEATPTVQAAYTWSFDASDDGWVDKTPDRDPVCTGLCELTYLRGGGWDWEPELGGFRGFRQYQGEGNLGTTPDWSEVVLESPSVEFGHRRRDRIFVTVWLRLEEGSDLGGLRMTMYERVLSEVVVDYDRADMAAMDRGREVPVVFEFLTNRSWAEVEFRLSAEVPTYDGSRLSDDEQVPAGLELLAVHAELVEAP